MRVALVSLNQFWEKKLDNFHACCFFVKKAKELKVDLIIFPEMTLTSFSMNLNSIQEDIETSQTVASFKELAAKFEISIIFGVVFRNATKATNNAVLINSKGYSLGAYSKIHPFSFSGESKFFTAGEKIFSTNLESVVIGITICYDLRFPEIYSALAKKSTLIVNIANWPAKRVYQWEILLKARAIENQLFVIGVNRTGVDGNGLDYKKSSMVINPYGESLLPLHTEDQFDVYDIDLSIMDELKKTFSTTQDRKPEFYKTIL